MEAVKIVGLVSFVALIASLELLISRHPRMARCDGVNETAVPKTAQFHTQRVNVHCVYTQATLHPRLLCDEQNCPPHEIYQLVVEERAVCQDYHRLPFLKLEGQSLSVHLYIQCYVPSAKQKTPK